MSINTTSLGFSPDGDEARDRLLARVAYEAIWVWDFQTQQISWEGNVKSIFGYERDEVVDLVGWWREHVHPQDRERVEDVAINATRSDRGGYSVEYRFRRKDGSWAWVASRGIIERDSQGQARRAVGAMMDISAFKESESRLRLFAEQIPVRASVTDLDLKVIWDAGAAFSDNPSAVGCTVPELFAQSPDRERVLDGCRKALAGESSLMEIDDGISAAQLCLRPFHDPAGNVTGVVGLAVDITARVRTEEKVRAGERLLRQVLETLPVGVAVVNQDRDVLLANAATEHIWGKLIKPGRERQAESKGFWHDSGAPVMPEEWGSTRAVQRGETSLGELIDIVDFDGQQKTIENSAAPIRDSKGEIVGAVIVNADVTKRVRAVEALRATERLLIDAEKLGHTGSWEQDLRTGNVLNTDANLRLFFGDDRGKGTRLEDFVEAVHPDDRAWVAHRREELLADTGPGDIEYRVIWPDDSVHWIFGRATVVRDPEGRPVRVYGTNADITERKRAAKELELRTQQLETLSRKLIDAQESERRAVARELHDDFGQVLTALRLTLQRAGHDDPESMALVDGAIARMRDLAQDLRPPLLDEYGLLASLRWYVEREARRAGLEFRLALPESLPRPPIAVETTCFRVAQEALTNVIRHARAHAVHVEVSEENGTVHLLVRDDGQGFDVEGARRRAIHGGSQGLLSMQERVTLARGELHIDSALGRGTTIHARLPIAARDCP